MESSQFDEAGVGPKQDPKGPEALSQAGSQVGELATYLSSYLESLLDKARISARGLLWGMALWPLGILVVAGIILLIFGFLFYGMTLGLAQVLGGRLWLSYLLTGITLLIFLALGLRYFMVTRPKKSLKKKIQSYEEELQKQKTSFGRSAEEQAARQ